MTEAKKYEYVLKAGTKLVSPEGEYTIKRVLGQGGYGITYIIIAISQYLNLKKDVKEINESLKKAS